MDAHEAVLGILLRVTGAPDLAGEMDTDLYDVGLLDSLGTVNLMLAFGDELGVTIHPSDFDKKEWATPRKMIADLERRLATAAR